MSRKINLFSFVFINVAYLKLNVEERGVFIYFLCEINSLDLIRLDVSFCFGFFLAGRGGGGNRRYYF